MTAKSRVVDGRELEPPGPLEATLAALSQLASGETLTLLLYREPFPLYALLRRDGHAYRAELKPDGTYEISIRKA